MHLAIFLEQEKLFIDGGNMIRIAIADDDPKEISILKEFYQDLGKEIHEKLHVISFTSGIELLNTYDYSYDLICLDIDMPEKNGIQIAKEIRKLDHQVLMIFVTNMAQMAIKGYEVQALDFIVKPINYYSFAMKIRNAINMIHIQESKNLVIGTPTGMQKISTDELYYVEVQGHYLYFHTISGVFKQKGALKKLENELVGLPFKRCNQCYLINLKHVDCVDKDEIKIGGDWLRISRPQKKEFLQSLANYMGGISL